VPVPLVDPVPELLPEELFDGFLVAEGEMFPPVEVALWLELAVAELEALLVADGAAWIGAESVAAALGLPAAPSMAIGASALNDCGSSAAAPVA
jgi:hypothetical protein